MSCCTCSTANAATTTCSTAAASSTPGEPALVGDEPPVLNADFSGGYTIDGQPTMITQTGSGLTFINERGEVSTGRFLNNLQVVADDRGGLLGDFHGIRIERANGTTWSVPNVTGEYTIDDQVTQIGQTGRDAPPPEFPPDHLTRYVSLCYI